MLLVDKEMYTQSSVTQDAHQNPTDIPTGATFTKDLNVCQETPVKGPPKVVAFLTLFTTLKLSTIKFENEVYMYLNKNEAYVKPDLFVLNDM
eukprot:695533-Ditylum_brightwellii.AAC.1